jgi:hypothetical protein
MSHFESEEYSSLMDKRFQELKTDWWGYAPCYDCLNVGNRVNLLPCPNGRMCHPEDGRIYEMVRSNHIMSEIRHNAINAQRSLALLKTGAVGINGSVSSLIVGCLDKVIEIVDSNAIDVKD